LHLLLAARDLTAGPAVQCGVRHGDGREVALVWTAGKDLVSSEGEWRGRLEPDPQARQRTDVVWTGQGDATVDGKPVRVPVRLFHTAWDNDDEWHAVKQLEWTLIDPQARVYLLGVTLESAPP
jgi:hypothetical protein